MIEEVKDFVSDVKKGVGDKGFMLIVIAVIGIFVFMLLRKDDSEDNMLYTANAYASYPDVDTNADVVIDTLRNEITNSSTEIQGAIDSAQSEIIQNDDSNTADILDAINSTNDYVNEGIEKTQTVYNLVENNYTTSGVTSDNGTVRDRDKLMEMAKSSGNVEVWNKRTTMSTLKNAGVEPGSTGSMKNAGVDKSSSKSSGKSSSTYTYKTKAGLNTSTSIVDALKATGANSSMSSRKKIAAANGIKNYSGTAKQNVTMLNKLKSGTLKKS